MQQDLTGARCVHHCSLLFVTVADVSIAASVVVLPLAQYVRLAMGEHHVHSA